MTYKSIIKKLSHLRLSLPDLLIMTIPNFYNLEKYKKEKLMSLLKTIVQKIVFCALIFLSKCVTPSASAIPSASNSLANKLSQTSLSDVGSKALKTLDTVSKAPTAQDSLSSILVKGIVKQNLGKIGISDPTMLTDIQPMGEFFVNLPNKLPESAALWDYNQSFIQITQPVKSNTENVTLKIDLQFKGHGDIASPIGFIIKNKQYYFNPSQSALERTSLTSGAVTSKNMLDNKFKMLLAQALDFLIPGDAGTSIYNLFSRISLLYPEDIFVLKIVELINTAQNNTEKQAGYPRIAHLPLEMMLLFKRLSITPNYKVTMQNHKDLKIDKAYNWKAEKILYFSNPIEALSSSIFGLNDTLINTLNNTIQTSIQNEQVFDYQDQKSKTPFDNDFNAKLIATESTGAFIQRTSKLTDLIKNTNFAALKRYFQKQFVKMILFHSAKRFSGFLEYSNLLKTVGDQTTNQDFNDVSLLSAIYENRMPQLKTFLNAALEMFKPLAGTDFIGYAIDEINKMLENFDAENNDLKDLITEIVTTRLSMNAVQPGSDEMLQLNQNLIDNTAALTKYISSKLSDGQDIVTLLPEDTDNQIVDLQTFFDILFYRMMKIQDRRYRGDTGYNLNPLPIQGDEISDEGLGIILRAYSDLQKAGDLFKADPKSYEMLDPTGKIKVIKGPDLYKNTVALADQLSASLAKETHTTKTNAINTGASVPTQAINNRVTQINDTIFALQTEYMHYLRQYNFDRRNSTEVVNLSTTVVSSAITSAATKEQAATNNLLAAVQVRNSAVNDLALSGKIANTCSTNNLFGQNFEKNFVIFLLQSYINYLLKITSNSQITFIKQNEITSATTTLAQKNKDLASLQAAAGQTTNTSTLSSQITSTQTAIKDLQTKIEINKALIASVSEATKRLTKVLAEIAKYNPSAESIAKVLSSTTTTKDLLLLIKEASTEASKNISEIESFVASIDLSNKASNNFANLRSFLSTDQKFTLTDANFATIPNSQNNLATSGNNLYAKLSLDSTYVDSFKSSALTDIDADTSLLSVRKYGSTLKLVSIGTDLNRIASLPSGFNSSEADIKKLLGINTTTTTANTANTATTTSSSTTATTSGTTTTQTSTTGQVFQPFGKSTSPDYASNINLFLYEEMGNLFVRAKMSSQQDFVQAFIDSTMVSLLGCSATGFLGQVSYEKNFLDQQDIDEIKSYDMTKNSQLGLSEDAKNAMNDSATSLSESSLTIDEVTPPITDEILRQINSSTTVPTASVDQAALAKADASKSGVSVSINSGSKSSTTT